MKWFIKCIKNYVNFRGRARRKEYWFFVLFALLFVVVARVLDILLFWDSAFGGIVSPISTLYALFIFLPQVAVMVRRLHDAGRSGQWVLWYYVFGVAWIVALIVTGAPLIAGTVSGSLDSLPSSFLAVLILGLAFPVWGVTFLVWFCTPGTLGDNKYGSDPTAVAE